MPRERDLALAAVGLYGVVSYSVSQRNAEIGIGMIASAAGTPPAASSAGLQLALGRLLTHLHVPGRAEVVHLYPNLLREEIGKFMQAK